MPSPVPAVRRIRAALSLQQILGGIESLMHALKNDIVGELHRMEHDNYNLQRSTSEQFGVLTGQLQAVEDRLDATQHLLERLVTEGGTGLAPRMEGRVRLEDIDLRAARYLNDVTAADGPLRESGHFVNHAVTTIWQPGEVRFEAVNERIIEIPFVHQAVGRLPEGSRILDVGGGESMLGLELASMGYQTTVLEPRGYPHEHPNLSVAEVGAQDFETAEPFDAVVLLSTIEHLGIGAYHLEEHDELDMVAMRALWDVAAPGGLLVLTTPFGKATTTPLERIYDFERLSRLLTGWAVDEIRLIRRVDATTWVVDDRSVDEPPDGEARVVLITARRLEDPDQPVSGMP